ncbi:MAG: glycosyltransferase family 4 protein [Bacteroidales bacterium]|nr:glycosyltransferase family 4 protein [Bacteroidales bacterium]
MKVLLAHPGKQHSFETAIALKRIGVLHKYITTVYDKPTSITGRFKCLLGNSNLKKANDRRCSMLLDDDVLQIYEIWGLLVLLISRIPFLSWLSFRLNLSLSNHFADKVAQIAISEDVDAIIVYDGISRKGLQRIKEKAPRIKTIMDVSISMRPFMKENFETDMAIYHHDWFYVEERYLWNAKYEKVIRNELKYVDYFFSPSEIVSKSIMYCGIDKSKIIQVPYGVNTDKFDYAKKTKREKDERLHLLFVGQISYRKGLHHILNVVSKMEKEVDITLAGSYKADNSIVRQYGGSSNIHFIGFATRDVLAKEYQKSDLFVLPSLGEGFAMVILEALSTGTPVLISNLSGGDLAVEQGENGFIYDALSEKELEHLIRLIINNKDMLDSMSENARKSALNFTWNDYHQKYSSEIKKILNI